MTQLILLTDCRDAAPGHACPLDATGDAAPAFIQQSDDAPSDALKVGAITVASRSATEKAAEKKKKHDAPVDARKSRATLLASLLRGAVLIPVDWSSSRAGLRVGAQLADGTVRAVPTVPSAKKRYKRGPQAGQPVEECQFRNLREVIHAVLIGIKLGYLPESVEIVVETGWENKNYLEHNACVFGAGLLPSGEYRLREFDPLKTKNARLDSGETEKSHDIDLVYIARAVRGDISFGPQTGRHRTKTRNAQFVGPDKDPLPEWVQVTLQRIVNAQSTKYQNEDGQAARAWLKAKKIKWASLPAAIYIASQVVESHNGLKLVARVHAVLRSFIERDSMRSRIRRAGLDIRNVDHRRKVRHGIWTDIWHWFDLAKQEA